MTGSDRLHSEEPASETALSNWIVVTGLIGFVGVVRSLPFASVFRDGDILLSGNDPYYYRTLVERVVARAGSPLEVFLEVPASAETGEPVLVAVSAFCAELLGGSTTAVGVVLAWYPVVTACLSALVVWGLGRRVSGDVRVGIAAVALFAVVPGHAARTGLGFADHHALDYLFLTTTVYALIGLMTAQSDREVRWIALLGVSVAGQTLAWEASPLLLAPLAASVAVSGVLLTRDRRPTGLRPAILGFGFATLLVATAHVSLGWQSTTVVVAPGLVLVWSVSVYALILTAVSRDRSPRFVLGGVSLVGLGLLVGMQTVPSATARATSGLQRLVASGEIAETRSLGEAFGPLVGPTVLLGFVFVLGLPAVLWHVFVRRQHIGLGWAVISVYGLYFLGLSTVQRRFVGELTPILAIAAGFGFVTLCARLGLTRPVRAPDLAETGNESDPAGPQKHLRGRRRGLIGGALLVPVFGFPGLFTSELHSRLTVRPKRFRAAVWMREFTDRRDLSWPDTYVFSRWGVNRFYNYFVSGRARSYTYAKKHFAEFLQSPDPETWYNRLRDRTGFVVVEDLETDLWDRSMHERLFTNLGSRSGSVSGVSHFRAVYIDGENGPKVFSLVPGARIVGTADPGATITLHTVVSVSGHDFAYERRTTADRWGRFEIVVPYPGTYQLPERKLTVSERAIRTGRVLRVGSSDQGSVEPVSDVFPGEDVDSGQESETGEDRGY